MNVRKKVLLSILIGTVSVVLLGYLGISLYYRKHFYPNTFINGINVSGKTAEEIKQETEAEMEKYQLAIGGREKLTGIIYSTDIGLKQKWDGSVEAFLNTQTGFQWIKALFKTNDLNNRSIIQFDEHKLVEQIKKLSLLDPEKQKQPVNAYISEYMPDQGYSIVPEENGNVIREDAFLEIVETSILALDEMVDVSAMDCYEKPEILEDDATLQATVETLNKYCEAEITYEIGSDIEVLDANTFHEWLRISETGEVSIDEESLRAYVSGMAKKYNTCYSPKKLQTSYGKEVKFASSQYGWWMNQPAEREMIAQEIKDGSKVVRDFNYSIKGASRGETDYGNSYVEINLTAQHLFLYVDGEKILESDFVSGKVSNGNSTPTGVFGLTYKEREAVLRGEDYETPVDYWMPFNGNVGMHDATWRNRFGGSIYKTGGSHGCINLPHDKAGKIYEYMYKNFPVFVYELPGTESKDGKAEAQKVDKKIKQAVGDINKLTLEAEPAIADARAQYQKLTSDTKKSVKNYELLVKAEKKLEELKAIAQQELEQAEETTPEETP